MTAPLSDKAVRYLSQLDAARCDGRWNDISELARKVEKHAPQRKCLATTARAEAQLSKDGPQRPPTSSADSSQSPLATLIPSLRTASEEDGVLPEDKFEANVCLGWAYWLLGDPRPAVERLPTDCAEELKNLLEGERPIGQWARVCAMKGAYIKGHALEKTGALAEASQSYLSMLPYLSSFTTFKSANPQFCLWTQCLLTRLCVVSASPTVPNMGIDITTKLWFFRIWQTFWMTSTGQRRVSGYDPRRDLGYLWRDVWFAYYRTLSEVLQRGWAYASGLESDTAPQILESPESLSNKEFLASRLRQRADLKNIEAINETFLLKETAFPKATGKNEDVEAWAEAVMCNWRVMCGPSWQDEELGEGGKSAVSRGVLDILYRAATKTFHSTQILRYLFTVHASLAEFDLALKAFDTYVEIITRGKERAEKSGTVDESLDDNDIMLRTFSEAIRILCRYGSRTEAEKAQEIGEKIENWLKQHLPVAAPSQSSKEGFNERAELPVSPKTVAIAYRAIGMSSAHWARLTFDAKARAGLQAYAVQCFGKALDPKYGDALNGETRYALGLLLAEMRDIAGAIKVVKQALAPVSQSMPPVSPDGDINEDEHFGSASEFLQQRRCVPLWHLLSLLLTARSEFETAARACDAAFEQFQDPSNLFGIEEEQQYKSDHLNALSNGSVGEKARVRKQKGVVDRMEAFEKESLLQVKLTQLTLVETLEGNNTAVDTCDQLLGLFARLFGDPSTAPTNLKPATLFLSPPKTARSFRESILGRSLGSKRVSYRPKSAAPMNTAISRPSTSATATTAAVAPTIQVTDEDGAGPVPDGGKHSHLFHHSTHPDRPTSKRSGSVKLQKRSLHNVAEEDTFSPLPHITEQGQQSVKTSTQPKESSEGLQYNAISGDDERPGTQSFSPIPHNISQGKMLPPHGQHSQPACQDVRLPAPFPARPSSSEHGALEPKLPIMQERRHKISLLVQVWLFIAGLYTRAAMYEDARDATNEASKLVQTFESEVSREDPSVRGFATRGWGGGKSVEALWGDIWAEKGELARARGLPHEAMAHYEKALSHFPDHPLATVGLSEILLDIYCQKIPPEPIDPASLLPSSSPSTGHHQKAESSANGTLNPSMNNHAPQINGTVEPPGSPRRSRQASPEELNRLAARDRAYSLLSALTKLGSGWDYSEAWLALARAYEEGGQIEKAKEVLWWTVELEDTRPIRPWEVVGLSGGVL